MRLSLTRQLFLPALAAGLATGCFATADDDTEDLNNDPPLANVDELLDGAPKADEIPRGDYKTDEVLPVRHEELLGVQSPVKSQGSRGVCSIFSTAALMEHLYLVEGTMADPDFSEQYLQWSVKFEVNSFPRSSGSSGYYNLQAISQYGIVEESVWPYEPIEWNSSNDPECDGEDDQPTRCYTNGHPSDEVRAAPKFTLPSGRYLNRYDIKRHIATEGTAVVAGMDFFYQSWNHRASELPINSTSWKEGYVIAPSAKDRELSLAKRAGHSILLVGWDDELELPVLDEEGNRAVDEDGNPITQTGCYIFKNSWGTDGFGIESAWGPGYGCISYDYIHEYASLRVSDLPTVELPEEVCGDGVDNDDNGQADCDDDACTETVECQGGEELSFDGEGDLAIPDNDPVGVSSTITVDVPGTVRTLRVDLDIEHTYRSDLRVSLHRDDQAVVLHDRSGGSSDDLVESFEVTEFDGEELAGEWRLLVTDNAGLDTGTLRGWSLTAVID